MSKDAYSFVKPRKPPGPNSWRCPSCSPKGVFDQASGAIYNGAQAEQCRLCPLVPTKKACSRFGTNGKNGGQWAKWDPSNPARTLTKAAAALPARLPPGVPPAPTKKELADEKRKNAALAKEIQQLKSAAGAATAPAAAATSPDSTIASAPNQASDVHAEIKSLNADIVLTRKHVSDCPKDQYLAKKLVDLEAALATKKAQLADSKPPSTASAEAIRAVNNHKNVVERSGKAVQNQHAAVLAAAAKLDELTEKHVAHLAKLKELESRSLAASLRLQQEQVADPDAMCKMLQTMLVGSVTEAKQCGAYEPQDDALVTSITTAVATVMQ